MTPILLFAAAYAFAASVQPGPLLTYIVSRSLSQGWRRALPAAFSPLLSDAPIILAALLVLSRLPAGWERFLHIGGGVFLLLLAGGAVRNFRRMGSRLPEERSSGIRSLLGAAGVNLLNPGPYLGWSLVMGPLLLKAWTRSPGSGILLVLVFYGTMVSTLAGIVLLFSMARRLGPAVNRAMVGASAAALAGFALYELWLGLNGGG